MKAQTNGDGSDRPSSVYWIHNDSEPTIETGGYVGVSIHPAQRLKRHLLSGKAFAGDKVDIIATGSAKACLALEKKLRPSPRIGRNICSGGRITSTFNRAHSEETKSKMRQKAMARLANLSTAEKKELSKNRASAYVSNMISGDNRNRNDRIRDAHSKRTPEQKAETSRLMTEAQVARHANRTPEENRATSAKMTQMQTARQARLTPAQRSAISKKGRDTLAKKRTLEKSAS